MGRINIEIPDSLHDQLRQESAVKNIPIKMIVIQSIREHCDRTELDVDVSALEN